MALVSSDSVEPGSSSSTAATAPQLTEEDVVTALKSLYDDELRPYGRILRKRLAELGRPHTVQTAEVDDSTLRAWCESQDCLQVEPEEGGEWSALLKGREPTFVDVYSTDDIYPEDMWKAAAEYFEADTHLTFPGGRYSSALALHGLPFFAGRSLGQVCHVVQLAIAQKKLLGYNDGAIVPYQQSVAMKKSRCAKKQALFKGPDDSGDAPALVTADWPMAQECMRELMKAAIDGSTQHKQVRLSNIKRLFLSKCRVQLSETVLGHSRLSELLQDEHFRDICSLQLKERGYVVVPDPKLVEDVLGGTTTTCTGGQDGPQGPSSTSTSTPTPPPPALAAVLGTAEISGGAPFRERLSESAGQRGGATHSVRRTFIDIPLPPTTGGRRRSRSWPGRDVPEASGEMPSYWARLFEGAKCQPYGPGPTDDEAPSGAQERVLFCANEPLDMDEALDTPASAPPALMTPSPWGTMDFTTNCLAVDELKAKRVVFCPGEPLECDEAALMYEPTQLVGIPLCTPSPEYERYGQPRPCVVRIAAFV
jgi:hypothetical protein